MLKITVKRLLSISMVLVILLSFAACGNKKDIEDMSDEDFEEYLEDYYNEQDSYQDSYDLDRVVVDENAVSVAFVSCNGYGKIDMDINRYNYDYAIGNEAALNYLNSIAPEKATEIISAEDEVTIIDLLRFYQENENNRLSNGDKVTIKVDVIPELAAKGVSLRDLEKNLDVSIKKEFNYEVSGLMTGTPIDILSLIEPYIVYKGANGGGVITVALPRDFTTQSNGCYINAVPSFQDETTDSFEIVYNNIQIGRYYFAVEKINRDPKEYVVKYSENDEFYVKIIPSKSSYSYSGPYETYINQKIMEYGFFFADIRRKFVAPNFGEYVRSSQDLSLQEIDQLINYIKENELSVYDTINVTGTYIGTLKPSVAANNGEVSSFVVAFELGQKMALSSDLKYSYFSYEINNIARKPDGTLEYERTDINNFAESTLMLESRILSSEKYDFIKMG